MIKRILAVVTDKDFYDFRRHAYDEELKIGEAFSALVHAYAIGEIKSIKRYKQERIQEEKDTSNSANYVKDHQENKKETKKEIEK